MLIICQYHIYLLIRRIPGAWRNGFYFLSCKPGSRAPFASRVLGLELRAYFQAHQTTDQIGTDIVDIIFIFIFLSDSDLNTDSINDAGYDMIGYRRHKYAILSIRIRIRYWMLNIWTRIWTDLNPSKRIQFRIRSENIRTAFIPTRAHSHSPRFRARPPPQNHASNAHYRLPTRRFVDERVGIIVF
jgi:hypothetical protein